MCEGVKRENSARRSGYCPHNLCLIRITDENFCQPEIHDVEYHGRGYEPSFIYDKEWLVRKTWLLNRMFKSADSNNTSTNDLSTSTRACFFPTLDFAIVNVLIIKELIDIDEILDGTRCSDSGQSLYLSSHGKSTRELSLLQRTVTRMSLASRRKPNRSGESKRLTNFA